MKTAMLHPMKPTRTSQTALDFESSTTKKHAGPLRNQLDSSPILTEKILPNEPPVLTVSELNRMARRALESQLPLLWVEGEISNFTAAVSGHWYFSLKDAAAQVRCVMFRGRNQLAGFTPANGDHVEIRALPSLYEARGEFQMGVETVRRAGAGRLYEAFLKLKAKLETEGLFDPAKKRALPLFPRCLGIVTSPQAAALHDVLTALARRMPGLPVILYPTPVQGNEAGAQIATAIRLAGQRAECDVLLVCRGGGALEDLWAFNDEAVARAIAASPIPVVSGVGHETDFTLADFAADVRAPTPTAAAELASPERRDLRQTLQQHQTLLTRSMERIRHTQMQRLDYLARSLIHPADQLRRQHEGLVQQARRMRHAIHTLHDRKMSRVQWLGMRLPLLSAQLDQQQQKLANTQIRLRRAPQDSLAQRRQHLDRLASNLVHLNPEGVLARGYSLVESSVGKIVRDAAALKPGDSLSLRFHRGSAQSIVKSTATD
jgi:exodeoxyribonuclease VII large subunit